MSMPPQLISIHMDSCAFDPKYSPEDKAADELYRIYERFDEYGIILEIAHSAQKEIHHPNTPHWVKERANKMIYTIETSLNDEERARLRAIRAILAGNGRIENIIQDANHIFEAQKYGAYFVTTDERLLKKREEIKQLCTLCIVKPSEMLQLIEQYGSQAQQDAAADRKF
jgi:predicted nucleic acid-binding protein